MQLSRTCSPMPSLLMSTIWPATRPSAPTALPTSHTTCSACPATLRGLSARICLLIYPRAPMVLWGAGFRHTGNPFTCFQPVLHQRVLAGRGYEQGTPGLSARGPRPASLCRCTRRPAPAARRPPRWPRPHQRPVQGAIFHYQRSGSICRVCTTLQPKSCIVHSLLRCLSRTLRENVSRVHPSSIGDRQPLLPLQPGSAQHRQGSARIVRGACCVPQVGQPR